MQVSHYTGIAQRVPLRLYLARSDACTCEPSLFIPSIWNAHALEARIARNNAIRSSKKPQINPRQSVADHLLSIPCTGLSIPNLHISKKPHPQKNPQSSDQRSQPDSAPPFATHERTSGNAHAQSLLQPPPPPNWTSKPRIKIPTPQLHKSSPTWDPFTRRRSSL